MNLAFNRRANQRPTSLLVTDPLNLRPRTVGQRVRCARLLAGLTQVEAGSAIGVSVQTIQGIELDQVGERSLAARVPALAAALCVDLRWLLDGSGEPPTMPLDTLAQRVFYAMALAGMTITDLARASGVPRTTLNRLLGAGGISRVSFLQFAAICASLGVTQAWLRTGDAPMVDDDVTARLA